MLHAENAYLFRHAITRDAAYQMQLPSERAGVHSMAFHLIEAAFGGRAPAAPVRDSDAIVEFTPHSTDPLAAELAEHARLAGDMATEYQHYLHRAGYFSESVYEIDQAYNAWLEASTVAEGAELIFVLRTLAKLHMHRHEFKEEEALLVRCLELAKDIGHRYFEAQITGALATVFNALNKHLLSEETFLRSLTLAQNIGAQRLECLVQINLGNLYLLTKRLDLATNAFNVGLAKAEELGAKNEYCVALTNVASCYAENGQTDKAEYSFKLAVTAAQVAGHHRSQIYVCRLLADIYSKSDRLELANESYFQAIELARDTRSMYMLAMCLAHYSDFLLDQNRPDKSLEAVNEAMDIFSEYGHLSNAGYACCRSVVSLVRLGLIDQASEKWTEGCRIFLSENSSDGLEQVLSEINATCAKAGFPPFELPKA